MKTEKILLGLIAGVAAGALLGILLAPDKGSETRKKILKKCEDMADLYIDKCSNLMCTSAKNREQMEKEGFATSEHENEPSEGAQDI